MGFILASHARRMSEVSKEERQRLVCEQYAREFGTKDALSPLFYVEKNWGEEEFTKGCYVGIMQPGTMTQLYVFLFIFISSSLPPFPSHSLPSISGKVLREPVGPIHFAGTETATVWNGYMDGAVQAGERAAHEVARELISASPEQDFSSRLREVASAPFQEVEPPSLDIPCFPTDPPLIEQMLPSVPGLIRFLIATGVLALSLFLYYRNF
jgi:hypothetical protein